MTGCDTGCLGRFLSTPSARRATIMADHGLILIGISIHALREEGDMWKRKKAHPRAISIHALREEGDSCNHDTFPSPWHFYPRPPRGGRRIQYADPTTFQPISIHALRVEGDVSSRYICPQTRHFYPRPPRGGRP